MINHCKISKHGIFLNGNRQKFSLEIENPNDWKKQLYSNLELNYPKFYKMDDLSKMAILSIELLKKQVDFKDYADDEISLIFSNSQSSSNTDFQFIESYTKSTPSPSLFVYTLPNITTGEIAIYMKWYGESIFLIQKDFNSLPIDKLLKIENKKGAKACLLAWVEKTSQKEECSFFFIKNLESTKQQDILTIYNQKNHD